MVPPGGWEFGGDAGEVQGDGVREFDVAVVAADEDGSVGVSVSIISLVGMLGGSNLRSSQLPRDRLAFGSDFGALGDAAGELRD